MDRKVVAGVLLTVILAGLLLLPSSSIMTESIARQEASDISPASSESSAPPIVLWNNTYGGTGDDRAWALVQTSDGGYAIAGDTISFGAGSYDFWLVKTDAAGNALWNKTYGGTSDDMASALVETSDGGYILAGHTYSFGAGYADFWLVKTDAAGNALWSKTYGGTGDDWAFALVQTSDGGYALAGDTWSFGAGYGDSWLVKTDAAGNALWNKTYGGAKLDVAYSVVQADDGGYALAGFTQSFGDQYGDSWLVKTDAAGNALWSKTYGGTDQDEAYALVETSDGGYALAGHTYSFGAGSADFWLIETDAAGNALWSKTYGGTDEDRAYALVQASEGGYALAGYTSSFGVGSYDFWLVKTDSAGNHLWNLTYGETTEDVAYALVETSDGGYALAGSMVGLVSECGDFWLVRVGSVATKATEFARSVIGARYQFGAAGYCYDRKIFVLCEDIIVNGYGWNFRAATHYGTGLDCSGLVFWSYNRAVGTEIYGDSLIPRTANGQYKATQPIERTDLKPGDLLFFDAYRDSRTGGYSLPGQDGHVDHVAMYAGEYQYSGSTYDVVEASGIGAVIPGTVDTIIARIRSVYGKNAFVGFGRVKEALAPVKMQVVGNSSIDLNVTDPDGFAVTKTASEAGDLFYSEFDSDGDGELEDVVNTWDKKVGDYFITVIPEAGAAPTDTYTIEVLADDATVIVAQNTSIAEIPTQPYIVTSNKTALIPRLDAHDIGLTQIITSKTIVGQNYILPSNISIFNYGNNTESFDVAVYANTTVITTLTDIILAPRNRATLSFSWNTTSYGKGNYTINAYIPPVLGETYTDDNNQTSSIVTVVTPGDVNADGIVDILDAAAVSAHWYPGPPVGPLDYNSNFDINDDGAINVLDAAIVSAYWTGPPKGPLAP